jgi:hypothetical protein
MSSITLEEIEARVAQVNDAATQPMRANALELLLYVDVLEAIAAWPLGDDDPIVDLALISAMAARALKAKPQLDLESAR